MFVEYADIAERQQIFLERFQFYAALIRIIVDPQQGEIRQPGLRTDAGKLGGFNRDRILLIPVLVLPYLDTRRFLVF